MDGLVRNHFERERDRIAAKVGPAIGKIGADMNARGVYHGGGHVQSVFKVHDDACRQIVGALVTAYKTVAQDTATPPTAAIIAEAKAEIAALISMNIERIRQEMLALAKRLQSGPLLTQEVERWVGDLRTNALIEGNREIDIWSETEERKKRVGAPVSAAESPVNHPWIHGIGTNAIGGLISAAVIACIGTVIYTLRAPQSKQLNKPDQQLPRRILPTSNTRPPATKGHTPPPFPAATIANAAAEAKTTEIDHLRTVQHIDRSIEDGRTAIIEAQRLFQKQFDEGMSAAAARGLSGSSVEQSLLYVANQTGQAKVDEIETKAKREIEDQLIQYGMTVPGMSQLPWLQPQATAYANFIGQAEAAKKGMASAVESENRQRRSHL